MVWRTFGVLGNKGGTGKTAISHFLAFGFGMRRIKTFHAMTEVARIPKEQGMRPYTLVDARTPLALTNLLVPDDDTDGVVIVDGAGNRGIVDDSLAENLDLILLPFRDGTDDVQQVLMDYTRLKAKNPNILMIPSQWPTNAKAAEKSEVFLSTIHDAVPDACLPKIDFVNSMKDLSLMVYSPAAMPLKVQRLAKAYSEHLDALLTGGAVDVPLEGGRVSSVRLAKLPEAA